MPVATGQERRWAARPVDKRTLVTGVEMTEWVLDRSRACKPAGTTGREQPLFTEQLVVLGAGEEPGASMLVVTGQEQTEASQTVGRR
jgi:hypothetical protein